MPGRQKPKAKRTTGKPRVQWSKIANAVSDVLVVGLYLLARSSIGASPDDQLAAFRGALEALAFVQALYSGNSVSEKYFTGKYHLFEYGTDDSSDETDTCG